VLLGRCDINRQGTAQDKTLTRGWDLFNTGVTVDRDVGQGAAIMAASVLLYGIVQVGRMVVVVVAVFGSRTASEGLQLCSSSQRHSYASALVGCLVPKKQREQHLHEYLHDSDPMYIHTGSVSQWYPVMAADSVVHVLLCLWFMCCCVCGSCAAVFVVHVLLCLRAGASLPWCN
jgi:hypothetical protein